MVRERVCWRQSPHRYAPSSPVAPRARAERGVPPSIPPRGTVPLPCQRHHDAAKSAPLIGCRPQIQRQRWDRFPGNHRCLCSRVPCVWFYADQISRRGVGWMLSASHPRMREISGSGAGSLALPCPSQSLSGGNLAWTLAGFAESPLRHSAGRGGSA